MFLMPGSRARPRAGVNHQRLTASTSADVALSNTGTYFDGPSVAQGSRGTWVVSGSVTLTDTAGAALFDVKLWDGTTIIDSVAINTPAATSVGAVALSGVISSPQSSMRISVKDVSSVSGKILFNTSGNSKDSSITAVRIA